MSGPGLMDPGAAQQPPSPRDQLTWCPWDNRSHSLGEADSKAPQQQDETVGTAQDEPGRTPTAAMGPAQWRGGDTNHSGGSSYKPDPKPADEDTVLC